MKMWAERPCGLPPMFQPHQQLPGDPQDGINSPIYWFWDNPWEYRMLFLHFVVKQTTISDLLQLPPQTDSRGRTATFSHLATPVLTSTLMTTTFTDQHVVVSPSLQLDRHWVLLWVRTESREPLVVIIIWSRMSDTWCRFIISEWVFFFSK